MKSRFYFLALASCVLLQSSCADDDKDNYSFREASNATEADAVAINLDALYSIHHSFSKMEAEEFALGTAKLLFDGNEGCGLKSAATNRRVSTTAAVLAHSDGLKSARASLPDTLAYVVNFEGKKGFAIVSADDRSLSRVLACFDKGEFNSKSIKEVPLIANIVKRAKQKITNDICNFELYKETAKKHFDEIVFTGTSTLKAKKFALETVTQSFGPLINTSWGQTYPYNRYCPPCDYKSCHSTSVVGCVNLAIAELLSHSEFQPRQLVCYTGAEVTLDWESMMRTKTMGSKIDAIPSTQKLLSFKDNEAVQMLLAQIAYGEYGFSNNMCLKHGGTGYTLEQLKALCGIFETYLRSNGFYCKAYASGLYNEYTHETTEESAPAWRDSVSNTILNHLKTEKRPIMVAAQSAQGGHAWIADGYKSIQRNYRIFFVNQWNTYDDEVNYIHHNWGWDGICNGYFDAHIYNTSKAEANDIQTKGNGTELDFYITHLVDIHR